MKRADIVERRRGPLLPADMRQILDEVHHAQEGHDADRDVDQEDPVPGIGVGQIAADNRAQDRRDDDGDRGERERLLAFFRREMIEDDGLLGRLQSAAEEALQRAEQQELPERGRQRRSANDASGEIADADQEISFAAQPAAERTGDRQHDAIGNQIGRQRPGALVVADRQAAGDMRQRNIHDVVSSTSMNAPSVTTIATSHGSAVASRLGASLHSSHR